MKRSLFLTVAILISAVASAQSFRQIPELQPSVVRGDNATPADDSPNISDALFSDGAVPQWIWGEDNDRRYTLATQFRLTSVAAARLKASADNIGTIYVNGRKVAGSSEWQSAMDADVTGVLQAGDNVIEAEVENQGGVAAFVLHLVAVDDVGAATHVVSDTSWDVSEQRGEPAVAKAQPRGKLGDGPWGDVLADSDPGGRVPPDVFELLPGFQVERLFTVPKDELGSWVCIAFDDRGRLLASDQGDKGICRITLPSTTPLARPGTGPGGERLADAAPETLVERLDFSNCEFQPTAAQGMLWAFDSLYLSINGGPGSGLYRARDRDGDDQFDECVKLKEFRGGGEHGPHALRLAPDGQRIFIICGNHTEPPFPPGEEFSDENYSSRVPTNWAEDLLLPRMWDANGHARGRMAPGGWIASTDPDGVSWEIWSIGYRNPYDMAFNADGELFAYDADMEWDMGLPWYRPTRVMHASSGSEFGWRSGSGKWPVHYHDSLPPLVNIGPGSPVGVEFGFGSPLAADSEAARNADRRVPCEPNGEFVYAPVKFPAQYQNALYICDWTFGTMYAIHIRPHLSGYTATKEEFLSRTPLPLTDVAAGSDGALYFTIGGRGTQSELFRVTYAGDAVTEPAVAPMTAENAPHQLRRTAETLHGTRVPVEEFRRVFDTLRQDGIARYLESDSEDDRFLRFAVRRAAEHTDVAPSILRVLQEFDPNAAGQPAGFDRIVSMATVLAHMVNRAEPERGAVRSAALGALLRLNFADLDSGDRLKFLRALSLVLIRTETTDASGAAESQYSAPLIRLLQPHFPSGDATVDRELCQMLVSLQAPDVVPATIRLLNEPPTPTVPDGLDDLILRNRGYGRAISALMQNAPDQQQVWYAYCLRVAGVGWTLESRADFFRWCGRAKEWAGGNSYRKFIQNMEDELWSHTKENDRVLLEAMEARTPFRMPELPKPSGPGHDWTLDEVRSLAESGLKNRDFENGQKMFAATRCILCHRFAGDGGATGPDLTQLAGRFNLRDLTEAIMDPGKVISDQYKGSTIVTTDGRTIAGRIVSENDQQISVLTDPEDSSKVTDLARGDIEDILPSQVSIMPKDLLKPLNEHEVLDLLAYLLSRGDKSNPMFR